MKFSFNLQTIVLVVLACVLSIATLVWAGVVYRSLNLTIIRGFDHKLLALSGTSAAFIDPAAHADFQRPHQLTALAPGPAGTLFGYDQTRQQLIIVATADGGALPLGPSGTSRTSLPRNGAPRLPAAPLTLSASSPPPVPSGPSANPAIPPLRSLAYLPATGLLYGLPELPENATAAASPLLAVFSASDGRAHPTVQLTLPLEGLFADRDTLMGWSGTTLHRIDSATGHVTPLAINLAVPVSALTAAAAGGAWLGLDPARKYLLTFDHDGRLASQTPLHLAPESAGEPAELPELDPTAAQPQVSTAATTAATVAATNTSGAAPIPHEPAPPLRGLVLAEGELYSAGASLLKIAPSGAVSVSPYFFGYFSENAPFFRRYVEAFRTIREATGLSYLYTLVYRGTPKIYYALDATVGDEHSPPGYEDDLPAETESGAQTVSYLGKAFVSDVQKWEVWGLIKVSLAPIQDLVSGQTVAMAGADVNITVIRQKTRWALFAVLAVGVGSILLAGAVSVKVSQTLTSPVRQIKDSALWMAAGYFGTQVKVRDNMELNRLAEGLGALGASLENQDRSARSYQSRLQLERSHAALRSALADRNAPAAPTAAATWPVSDPSEPSGSSESSAARSTPASSVSPVSPVIPPPPLGPSSAPNDPLQASGTCETDAGALLWIAPQAPDGLAAACLRARVSRIAYALLRANELTPSARLTRLAAAAPALVAVAHWDPSTNTLEYLLPTDASGANPPAPPTIAPILFTHSAPTRILDLNVATTPVPALPALTHRVVVPSGHTLLWSGCAWRREDQPHLEALARHHPPGSTEFWAGLARLATDCGLPTAALGTLLPARLQPAETTSTLEVDPALAGHVVS